MGITNKIKIFRPIRKNFTRQVKRLRENYKIVMMCLVGILKNISPEKIYNNVIDNVTEGSILVFHNNKKKSKQSKANSRRYIY